MHAHSNLRKEMETDKVEASFQLEGSAIVCGTVCSGALDIYGVMTCSYILINTNHETPPMCLLAF